MNFLTGEIISSHISVIARTANGLGHAYTKIQCNNLDLTAVDILESYTHLRYIDLARNAIESIECLANLEFILFLDVSDNQIATVPACLDKQMYLQHANFNKNNITAFRASDWALLAWLNLNDNRITEISLRGFISLSHLELRNNKLTQTSGLQRILLLRRCYLGQNQIVRLQDMDALVFLQLLHLRDNNIKSLDGFSAAMEELSNINLRNNEITDFIELEKLSHLPALRKLVLSGNPIASLPDYRVQVLMRLPHLERLDKDVFSEDEREEAKQLQKSMAEREPAQSEAVENGADIVGEESPASNDEEDDADDDDADDA